LYGDRAGEQEQPDCPTPLQHAQNAVFMPQRHRLPDRACFFCAALGFGGFLSSKALIMITPLIFVGQGAFLHHSIF
jgi:hypothetical protein